MDRVSKNKLYSCRGHLDYRTFQPSYLHPTLTEGYLRAAVREAPTHAHRMKAGPPSTLTGG